MMAFFMRAAAALLMLRLSLCLNTEAAVPGARGGGRGGPGAGRGGGGLAAAGRNRCRLGAAGGEGRRLAAGAGVGGGAWGGGYAVDRAGEAVHRAGGRDAILDLGGQVSAIG